MRHKLNSIFRFSIILVIGIILHANVGYGLTYISLSHQPLISPDGKYLVMIKENRYVRGSEFSLNLWTMILEGEHFANDYALTPRYDEVVASPDSKIIAFVEYNMTTFYGVHFYLPEKGEVNSAQAYSVERVDSFQFSKDQKYYRFRNTLGHKFDTMKENLAAAILGPAWTIYDINEGLPANYNKENKVHWTKKEADKFTDWAPIKKPKVIPQFLTQPMPKITLETQDLMQWSPDSKYLYLFDKTGLWRCDVRNYYMPQWTKLVNVTDITRYELSPTGKHLVYEVLSDNPLEKTSGSPDPDGLENIVWLLDLEKINVETIESPLLLPGGNLWELDATEKITPQKIASGWGAKFHPNGNILFYANLKGPYRLILDTMELWNYHGTSQR